MTLAWAAATGDLEVVLQRLGEGISPDEVDPLIAASFLADVAEDTAPSAVADRERLWNRVLTPPMLACRFGNLEIVQVLLANGADPMRPTLGGRSLVTFAIAKRPHRPDDEALRSRYLDCARTLIAAGVPVNPLPIPAPDDDEWLPSVPLSVAALQSDGQACALLLSLGADPNWHGAAGRTPMHFAVEFGSVSVVRQLVAAGGSAHTPNEAGVTPLQLATSLGRLDLVRILKRRRKR